MSTTVILAAGLFPTTPRALDVLHNADYIACCDGAANACVDAGFEPDVIVGDGDSVREDVRERYADRIVRIAEQETNDLTKTFHHVLKQGRLDRFVILANLALLMDYAEEHPTVMMVSDFGTFYPARDQFSGTVTPGCEVSIFNFGAKAFSARGLQYPLYDFTRLWQGTLNVALCPDIEIRAEGAFLVYVAEPDR